MIGVRRILVILLVLMAYGGCSRKGPVRTVPAGPSPPARTVPAPEGEQPRIDLAQAQSAIDVLLMLRDKTQGNRSEQESRLLEDILYDLQMRFVRAVREAARPSAS